MKITVLREVTDAMICNAIVGTVEGGYSPWLGELKYLDSDPAPQPGLVWYGQEALYNDSLRFKAVYDDPEQEEGTFGASVFVDYRRIREGLQYMARAHNRHFNDLVEENDDAITHDVFMQCVVLKRVVYG